MSYILEITPPAGVGNITPGASPITDATYNVVSADETLLFDPSSADQTVNLMDPTTNKGKMFTFQKVVATPNTVTLTGFTMNSSSEVILGSLWDYLTIQSNGVNYVIVGGS